jgi:NADPH2:quinone reductase
MDQRGIAPAFGGIDVLERVEVEAADPGPHEVSIRTTAIGVNPSDYKSLGGGWNPDPSQLPLLLGQELAGVVTAVGPGVEGFADGDAVIAFKIAGVYATRVTVPVDAVFAKPRATRCWFTAHPVRWG